MLYGEVYLDASANCNFGPFCPPKRASREAFKVRSCDGMYELSFKFIGNGYLKLGVSWEMVFMNPDGESPQAPPAAAAEVFEFVGIWRDREKEKTEQQERMKKARRSPSPREIWFEMNHPMGSWHQSRYSWMRRSTGNSPDLDHIVFTKSSGLVPIKSFSAQATVLPCILITPCNKKASAFIGEHFH
jgi:hypothetical protein